MVKWQYRQSLLAVFLQFNAVLWCLIDGEKRSVQQGQACMAANVAKARAAQILISNNLIILSQVEFLAKSPPSSSHLKPGDTYLPCEGNWMRRMYTY